MNSMTGYGRAQGIVAGRQITVEVRCYNHRFKDVRVKLPRGWMALEVPTENLIRSWLGRGKAECSVRSASGAAGVGVPSLDQECARDYLRVYKQLADIVRDETGELQNPPLELLARSEGVVALGEVLEDRDSSRKQLEAIIREALNQAGQMRTSEGAQLAREIGQRLDEIEKLHGEVKQMIPGEQAALKERTTERIRNLAGQVEVSEERLAQEMAILSERMDVTEELTRLESHLGQFRKLMNRAEPVGRELDFLLQEMNREVNTLSSKIHSAAVVTRGVSLKAEIEKVREQIQNVE